MNLEVKVRLIKHVTFLENELEDYGNFMSLLAGPVADFIDFSDHSPWSGSKGTGGCAVRVGRANVVSFVETDDSVRRATADVDRVSGQIIQPIPALVPM